MKKFIKYLTVLLLTTLLVDNITLVSLDRLISHSKIRYSRMLYDEYDIAILGNSRGVNSVSEEIFENTYDLNILNLSHNGLSKNEIFHLAGRVKDSTIVFIEITALLWDTSSVESNAGRLDVFSNLRKEKFRLLQSSVFNHEIFLRCIYYLKGSDANWTNNGVLTNEKLQFLISGMEANSKELFYRKDEFKRLSEKLAKRGISTVFYVAPIRRELVQYENWDLTLVNIESDFPNFVDLSYSVTTVESFTDLLHTNKKEINKIHNSIYEEYHSHKIRPTNISADGF